MSLYHSTVKSFPYAFSGIKEAFKNEPNFRVHVIIALTAMILAALLGFSQIEWLILLMAIVLVIILELVNTSLEAIVDLASPQKQEKAKVAKNVAAAAVLISSLFALIVGVLLFLPKLTQLFTNWA